MSAVTCNRCRKDISFGSHHTCPDVGVFNFANPRYKAGVKDSVVRAANQYAALAAETHVRVLDNDQVYESREHDIRARDNWWRAAFMLIGAIKG